MILVQAVVNWLIIIMATVLALFTVLLLTLHLTNSIKSKRIQAMRQQLICLISGEAAASRLKNKLYEVIRQEEGCDVKSISQIRGIRSMRGLLVISEIADELSGTDMMVLCREIGGEWYSKYLNQQFADGTVDSVILVVKLVGTLGLKQYIPDVVQQIYCQRVNPHMQHIGLLSLCLLGSETSLVSICRDPTIASLLSFRTLEELFTVYKGNREALCKRLIGTAADQYIRRTCVKAIGEYQYTSLAALVLPLLDSPQLNMQIDAARTLGQLSYAPAYPKIAAMAKSERWELRAVVASALASFGVDENQEALIDLLCDREWWVRFRAAESLKQSKHIKAILNQVKKRNDRYALEMLQFALDKQALRDRKGVA
ncbi:MAG TPA: HEAT repeat domain-containing protein [Candidatus Cryosericum sp.]|nr:HEAT repeat domain-containing protein [Candidatus Cryosericum sp.]